MADKKISALTAATTPLAGTEVLPIVQSGSTVKVSVANLTAGRATNALKQSVSSFTPDGGGFIHEASAASVTSRYWRTANDVAAWADWALQQSTDNTGAAYTTRFYFDGNGNATVSSGNLVVGTAGKGIDFSANGGDVLTQYDEGTWTVTWTNLTGTPTNLTGYYTRIGRLVTFSYSAGAASISGVGDVVNFSLPFNPAVGSVGSMISQTNTNGGSIFISAGSIAYPQTFSGSYMVFAGSYIV